MNAHTPGPWEVLDGAVLSKGLNDYGNWIVCGINREQTEQDAANLRLIAAAPDLGASMFSERDHYQQTGDGQSPRRDQTG